MMIFSSRWGRKRILPAVDGNVLRPKVGWGTDTYYPYVTGASLQEQVELTSYLLFVLQLHQRFTGFLPV